MLGMRTLVLEVSAPESRLTKRSSVKRDNAGRLLAPFALSAQQCCELLRGPRNKFATTP